MHGLVVGVGRAAPLVSHPALLASLPGLRPEHLHLSTECPSAAVAVLDPGLPGSLPPFTRDPACPLQLALTGYLVCDRPGPPASHPQALLGMVHAHGLTRALGEIAAGSYVLATFDTKTGEVSVANDPMGTIAVFHAEVPGGAIITTIPSLLRLGGLLPAEPDWTAAAEMVYIGYTLSRRYMLAGSQRLPTASILRWVPGRARLEMLGSGHDPLRAPSDGLPPQVDEVGDLLERACRRLVGLGGRTASLLSGGMDSRLLLAAWPRELELPAYSYGPTDFADVAVARCAAAVRGSRFVHVPLPPDEVAANLDDIWRFAGPPSFPNRYLAARRIREDGYDSVLDGYLGGAFLGGEYYRYQRRLRRWGWLEEKLGRISDVPVRRVGLDALAEIIWTDIVDPVGDEWARAFLGPEAAARFAARKDEIRQDLWTDLRALASVHDSAARVLGYHLAMNRSAHYIAQQGMLCWRFVRPYFPLTNDVALMAALMRLRPRQVGQRRLQIRLFRRRYPAYAAVPYANSLVPVGRHPLVHVWGPTLRRLSGGWPRPAITGTAPDYDEWDTWLRGSARLRDYTVTRLASLGMADARPLRAKMDEIAAGRERGAGELVHLASVAALLEPAGVRV